MLTNHTFALTTPSWNIKLLDKVYQMYGGLSTKFDVFYAKMQNFYFAGIHERFLCLLHILTAEVCKGVSALNEVAHSIFYAPQYVAIEKGYFKDEGLDLTLVTGFGADKTMTAVISGEADIGFMGAEASIYAYQEGATDPVVNFAQLTQRAGNFLVAREEMPDFKWEDLKGKKVLGGRKGGVHISM